VALYTERSNAGLIVATDSIVSIRTRIRNKDSNLGKRRAREMHSNAVQKILSEVTRLSERNTDHGVCGDKITCS
jgi:hypothetical protein